MAVKAKSKSTVMGYCVQDSREYPADRFYAHNNTELFPKGLVPYCKDCCNTMLKYYLKKTGTLEASMWYVCARLDMPFIKNVFENAGAARLQILLHSMKRELVYLLFPIELSVFRHFALLHFLLCNR